MTPRAALFALVLGVALPAAAPAAPPSHRSAAAPSVLPLARKALSALPLVSDVLDHLTVTQLPADVRVTPRGERPQARLVFSRELTEVTVTGDEDNWRGRLRVIVTVPARISYSIDLQGVSAGASYDGERRLLRVRLAAEDIAVEAIEPDLSGLTVVSHYSLLRPAWWDARQALELQNRLLREDYLQQAREVAEEWRPAALDTARQRVRAALKELYRPVAPDLEVVCD